jgi:hypothetical protein
MAIIQLKDPIDEDLLSLEQKGEGGKAWVRIPDSWDEAEGVHKFAMLRWDTGSLSWVPFAGGSGGVFADVTVLNFPSIYNIEGLTEHDSDETSTTAKPVVTGSQAIDSGDGAEPSAVASGDAVRSFYDLRGYQIVKDRPLHKTNTDLSSLEGLYDDGTAGQTSRNSSIFSVSGFRKAVLAFNLISAGVGGHSFGVIIAVSDGTDIYSRQDYFIRYEDQAFASETGVSIPVDLFGATQMRISMQIFSGSATLTFTVSDTYLALGT